MKVIIQSSKNIATDEDFKSFYDQITAAINSDEPFIIYDGTTLCIPVNAAAKRVPDTTIVPYETSLMWAIKDLLDDAVELARKIPLPAEF